MASKIVGLCCSNCHVFTFSWAACASIGWPLSTSTDVNGRAVESEGAKSETAPGGSETILLVEDEPAVRKAAAEFLRPRGYTVLEAKDGLDGLSVAPNHGTPIHLVVTDVVMPDMIGGQLAKELARLRPDARLLFVSDYAGKTVLGHKVFDLETNFLQKPYTLKQLSTKIRQALTRGASQTTNTPWL